MSHSAKRWKLASAFTGIAILVVMLNEFIESLVYSYGNWAGEWGRVQILAAHAASMLAILIVLAGIGYWISGSMLRRYHRTVLRIKKAWNGTEAYGSEANGVETTWSPGIFPSQQIEALLQVTELYAERYRQTISELQRTNEFLRSMIQNNPSAIYILDLEGRVLQVNPAFVTMFGFQPEEVIGTVDPVLPVRLAGETQELIGHLLAGQAVIGLETVRCNANGKEVQVSLTVTPIVNDKGDLEALAIFCRNITERKETEEMLRRSEKLSVVGQLAAGVAHEIRNPLTTLRGFVQMFRQQKVGKPVHLDLMLEELDRINLIVSEFIVLAKPHLIQYMFKDVGGLLEDMARILESQANMGNILLEMRIEPGLPKIRCEENQLKQVFLNIIKNGMESMPGGGTVTLEARRIENGCVLIRIRDRGTGIPEDVLSRLGEPFVTNKENGTGLGIMISQQIIANHKGELLIKSEIGRGTCVDIILPEDFRRCESGARVS